MAKYSFELKLEIVTAYLNGEGSYPYLSSKYHVPQSPLKRWVNSYQTLGSSGLQRKRQNTSYSPQFKLNAVNLYLTSKKSYREVANDLKINEAPILTGWDIAYRDKGEAAFSNPRGRPRKEYKVSKPKNKDCDLNTNHQAFTRLEQENLNLRMDVEYLKGLRRLRQEQHKRENHEWSANSDENSSSQSRNF